MTYFCKFIEHDWRIILHLKLKHFKIHYCKLQDFFCLPEDLTPVKRQQLRLDRSLDWKSAYKVDLRLKGKNYS